MVLTPAGGEVAEDEALDFVSLALELAAATASSGRRCPPGARSRSMWSCDEQATGATAVVERKAARASRPHRRVMAKGKVAVGCLETKVYGRSANGTSSLHEQEEETPNAKTAGKEEGRGGSRTRGEDNPEVKPGPERAKRRVGRIFSPFASSPCFGVFFPPRGQTTRSLHRCPCPDL